MSDRAYVYEDFPEELYNSWIKSGTIGGFYNANVRSRFEAVPLPLITFPLPKREPKREPARKIKRARRVRR